MPRSEAQTQARSRPYRLLGRAFAFPEGALYQDLAGGAWEREVAETLEALPFSLNLADLSLTPTELPTEYLQAEYARLFEVGFTGGPPCSIFVGYHERDRQRVMEKLIRFTRKDYGRLTAALAAI